MLPSKSILALDIGLKHTGCAFFSGKTSIAIPLEIVHHNTYSQLEDAIDVLVKQYNVTDILIGLPYSHLKGENEQINIVQDYSAKLQIAHQAVTFHTSDERYTSQVVHNSDDSLAALELLNTFLKRGLTKEK